MNPNRKPIPLYVPKVLDNGDPVFVMSATHRGDMYHLRAALQLPTRNYSLVLYNSNHTDATKTKTKDLEDYLSLTVLKNKKHVFVIPWTYEQLNASEKSPPKHFDNCFLDGKAYHGKDSDGRAISRHNLLKCGETDATLFIAEASSPESPQQKGLPAAVRDGMAILDEHQGSAKTLPAKFKNLLENTWGIQPNQPAILAMYRDTGTSKAMGVYPELDTGTAIEEIGAILPKLPKKDGHELKLLSCGLKGAAKGTGIGEYWLELKKLKEAAHETARDLEAYFLKWAYDNRYFRMATGFRSGPLDLFTFMGIPTVSIGLRKLIGEERHALLAEEWFQRVNIQYDQPRHNTTAYIKHMLHTPTKPRQPVIGSPFWGGEKPSQPPDQPVTTRKPVSESDKATQQMKPPGRFAPFDSRVVEIGFRVACQRYMSWPESAKMQKGAFPSVVTTSTARSCYLDGATKSQYFDESKRLDEADVQGMRAKLWDVTHTLQESSLVFGEYQTASENDWTGVYFLLGDEDAYDV